jgi:hypothetical protein
MAWRASVGTVFRSIKFTFNEASSSSWGIAGFLESNYSHLKAHNPNLPVSRILEQTFALCWLFDRFQVLVRSSDEPKPVMDAATWDGR